MLDALVKRRLVEPSGRERNSSREAEQGDLGLGEGLVRARVGAALLELGHACPSHGGVGEVNRLLGSREDVHISSVVKEGVDVCIQA